MAKTYRAGEAVEDYCRACKTDRIHTVVAADQAGVPIRVSCGYCRSEHNYRGGPRIAASSSAPQEPPARHSPPPTPRPVFPSAPIPERTTVSPMPASETSSDLEALLRRVIREETGLTPVAMGEKWRGGSLVLKPGRAGLQDKVLPIDTFFHKVVMLRNRLRTLEQQLNASDLSEDTKVKLQAYITGCYGSLTSFNVLFADDAEGFRGAGGDD